MSASLFQYVLIPANAAEPVQIQTGNVSGGLEHDELVQSAKNYFFQQQKDKDKDSTSTSTTSSKSKKKQEQEKHLQALRNATPEQRNQLAERYKAQHVQFQALANDQILQLLEHNYSTNTSGSNAQPLSCEIMALTVPTKGNGFQAVSMYISQYDDENNDSSSSSTWNERASGLVLACGHALPGQQQQDTDTTNTTPTKQAGIYGDVFVGRAYDDEAGGTEWKRLDFLPNDTGIKTNTNTNTTKTTPWIQIARTPGGGGGSGNVNSSAPSLSGSMKQLQLKGGKGATGASGAEVAAVEQQQKNKEQQQDDDDDLGYTWTQTDQDVELKMQFPSTTKGKDIKVTFGRNTLTIINNNNNNKNPVVIMKGAATGGPVLVEDCTYTLQTEGDGKELCVVLEKAEPGRLWANAVVV